VHGVRRHILELLKERNAATVAELAEWLGMAPVSVRHHLDILQGDNLIRVERLERRGSVGRPQQVYALTDEAAGYFPNNFALLAANLVRQVKAVLPPEQVETLFRSLAHELAADFKPADASDACDSGEARVRRVAEFLNARGYLASFEPDMAGGAACSPIELCAESDGSFLLHKHNCPYAGISGEHNELCVMDQTLVDTLFDQHCERIAHMGSQDRCCTYRVRPAAGLHADEPVDAATAFEVLRRPIQLVA
jgi:predicted ArsR family transcriptional regulator